MADDIFDVPAPETEPHNTINEKAQRATDIQRRLESYKGMIQIGPDTLFLNIADDLESDKGKAFKYEKSVTQEDLDAASQGLKIQLKNIQIVLDELKALEGM